MCRVELFRLLSRLIAATVVSNRLARLPSVSPFLTVYFVRNAGDGELDGDAEGDGRDDATIDGDGAADAAADGDAWTGANEGVACAAGDPPDSRLSATIANATTMRATRASCPGARSMGSRET